MSLTVGTAGHVDHGKTWLVRALTGKDTDRLREERERGISIELGYAPLELPDGTRLSLVDVPGHERFVRTMVAGATGIDLFLLVVDANEGTRPQTHEHLAILRLLGVDARRRRGDEVGRGRRGGARARRGRGTGARAGRPGRAGERENRQRPRGAPRRARPPRRAVDRRHDGWTDEALRRPRLHAPRRWNGRDGHTVVGVDRHRGPTAGRALGARRARPDRSRPRPDRRARGGRPTRCGEHPGSRAARARARRRAHHAGRVRHELPARRAARRDRRGSGRGQRAPRHVADRGAGRSRGRVARAASPPRSRRRGPRRSLRPPHGDDGRRRGGAGPGPPRAVSTPTGWRSPKRAMRRRSCTSRSLGARAEVRGFSVGSLERADGWVFAPEWLDDLRAELRRRIAETDPIDPGVPPPSAPWADVVVPLLGLERRGAKLYEPGVAAVVDEHASSRARKHARARRLRARRGRACARRRPRVARPPRARRRRAAIGRAAYASAREALVAECESTGSITLARFRDLLGSSRRPAQLLLERFDADGLTRRVGDARVLRRRARP